MFLEKYVIITIVFFFRGKEEGEGKRGRWGTERGGNRGRGREFPGKPRRTQPCPSFRNPQEAFETPMPGLHPSNCGLFDPGV